ncbi:hypothetical protein [Massilia aquatica]|uniref:hypothetical protein n=1 Tax=Massilia aquatica TaxID=2609000 RepID=UPI001423E363|nr:hypothetical protein [Massilia aquatica]
MLGPTAIRKLPYYPVAKDHGSAPGRYFILVLRCGTRKTAFVAIGPIESLCNQSQVTTTIELSLRRNWGKTGKRIIARSKGGMGSEGMIVDPA